MLYLIMLKNWLSLGIIVLTLILLTNFLWPRNKIFSTQLNTARWPLSIKRHLQMAKTYFENGYEHEAIKEYQQAERLYQYFSFIDLSKTFKNQLEETKKIVYQRQRLKNQIEGWETVLKSKPYYRDVLVHLSVLNYQIWEDEKAKEYWQQAFYLDPNSPQVQEMGKILGIRN